MFVIVFSLMVAPRAMAGDWGSRAVWIGQSAGWTAADIYRTKKQAETEKARIYADVAIQGGWQNVEHHRIKADAEVRKIEAAARVYETAARTGASGTVSAQNGTVSVNVGTTPARDWSNFRMPQGRRKNGPMVQ